jgi:hypothetical protein
LEQRLKKIVNKTSEIMKNVFMILIVGIALTACGGGNNSEANRDDTDNYENNSPAVTPQDNSREGMDTTGVDMQADTTTAGGKVGATSGSGVDGSDMNGADDGSSTESDNNP